MLENGDRTTPKSIIRIRVRGFVARTSEPHQEAVTNRRHCSLVPAAAPPRTRGTAGMCGTCSLSSQRALLCPLSLSLRLLTPCPTQQRRGHGGDEMASRVQRHTPTPLPRVHDRTPASDGVHASCQQACVAHLSRAHLLLPLPLLLPLLLPPACRRRCRRPPPPTTTRPPPPRRALSRRRRRRQGFSCGASCACRRCPCCRRCRAGRCTCSCGTPSGSTSRSRCPPRRSTTRGRSPRGA